MAKMMDLLHDWHVGGAAGGSGVFLLPLRRHSFDLSVELNRAFSVEVGVSTE